METDYLTLILILLLFIAYTLRKILVKKEPLINARFRIEIDGIAHTGMTEISGMDMSVETIEYREGTDRGTVRYVKGLPKCGTLTVKFALTDSTELYHWFKSTLDDDIHYRDISVIAMNQKGEDIARWNLVRAWPSRYEGPNFNAKGNDIAIETLEIVHEGVERVN